MIYTIIAHTCARLQYPHPVSLARSATHPLGESVRWRLFYCANVGVCRSALGPLSVPRGP
jgi:hypothetical protein